MHLASDIRYAFRQMHRSPGFAITAVLTLAVGIGATTAIFSLIYITMLKPLPVKHPAELYKVGHDSTCCVASELPGNWSMFSNDLYQTLRDHTQGFQGTLAAFQAGETPLLVHREHDPQASIALLGRMVSGNYFSVLGAPVAMGRGLTPADDQVGAPPVTVISDRMWQRRFGGDPHIVGETLMTNGTAVTIVGVTAPGFVGETINADMPELWIPLWQEANFVHEGALGSRPDRYWLDMIGRIAPDAVPAKINAQLNTELRQWLQSRRAEMQPDERAQIDRQHTEIASAEPGINIVGLFYDQPLKLLMVAAAFVMLIVCANVANLLLVKCAGSEPADLCPDGAGSEPRTVAAAGDGLQYCARAARLHRSDRCGVRALQLSAGAGVSGSGLCADQRPAFAGHAWLRFHHRHGHFHSFRRGSGVDFDAEQPGQCAARNSRTTRSSGTSFAARLGHPSGGALGGAAVRRRPADAQPHQDAAPGLRFSNEGSLHHRYRPCACRISQRTDR